MVAETNVWWDDIRIEVHAAAHHYLELSGKTKSGENETIYINLFSDSVLYDFMDATLCAFDGYKQHRLEQIENQLAMSKDPATLRLERSRVEG